MNYLDITIEEAEIIKQIIFKTEKFIEDLTNAITNIAHMVIDVTKKIAETIEYVFNNIKEYVIKLFNKKISKKRFMKLLQSKGMQRNDIDKIVRNNKDKYTMWRLLINSPPYYQR